jgi:anaerobic ribonucleoside-triphosphate reductase activating protein
LQASDLFLLAKEIKEKTDLTLHIFTGFELNELKTDEQRKLLNLTDTLVYGRFDGSKPNNNQKVWYNPQSREFWDFNNTDVEIDVDDNGDINISGFPTLDLISDMEDIQNERI